MPGAVANTARWTGLAIEQVVAMASTIPAQAIGMTTAGTISVDWDSVRLVLTVCGSVCG